METSAPLISAVVNNALLHTNSRIKMKSGAPKKFFPALRAGICAPPLIICFLRPCEVSVSRKRPRKEVRLQVTLEGGYSSRETLHRATYKQHYDNVQSSKKFERLKCHKNTFIH